MIWLQNICTSYFCEMTGVDIHPIFRDRAKQINSCHAECLRLFQALKCRLKVNDLSGNIEGKIHRTIILTLVLYGCGTRSSTLKEERRLWVLENRVLRKMHGPKRDGITGEWRRLNNEFNDVRTSHQILFG